MSGRVTTAVNMLVFVAAFVAQWAVGAIIDVWSTSNGQSLNAAGFNAAFGILLLLELEGLFHYLLAPVYGPGFFIKLRNSLQMRSR